MASGPQSCAHCELHPVSQPRVTVVIPAYNNRAFVADALHSVLAQSYENYEIVVADHSSTDGTGEILEAFRAHSRLRILSPTPSGGGAKANWNRVSSVAEGEWIKLVCGDDLLHPHALATQVIAAENHPSAVMIASRRRIIDAAGRSIIGERGLASLNGLVDGREAIQATVRAGANIFGEPACVLLRREVLSAVGWWTDEYPYLLDEATYAKVLLCGSVVAVREPLASFRVSAHQWSVRLARRQAADTVAFHRDLERRYPGLLSRSDVLVGNLRARGNAMGRRIVYATLDIERRSKNAILWTARRRSLHP